MKIAIIGLGRMGRRHIEAAHNLEFDVVGVYDPVDMAVELAKREQGIVESQVFYSPQELLEVTQPDALVVASTAPSHCEYVCMAAAAGVNYILCEKPMAISISECDQMIEACQAAGAILAVNHQRRYMDRCSVVKTLTQSDRLGGLCSVTVAASNFGLAMNGSHFFEMFGYLTEEEIDSVSFWADEQLVPNPRGEQYQDRSGQLRAVTPKGVRLYMEIGGDQGHGLQVIYGCRHGQVYVDELSGYLRYSYRKEEFRQLPSTRYAMPADIEVIEIEPIDAVSPTQAVWRAMLSGNAFPDGLCGRHAVRALVAANVSAEREGALVRLSDQSLSDRVFPWA